MEMSKEEFNRIFREFASAIEDGEDIYRCNYHSEYAMVINTLYHILHGKISHILFEIGGFAFLFNLIYIDEFRQLLELDYVEMHMLRCLIKHQEQNLTESSLTESNLEIVDLDSYSKFEYDVRALPYIGNTVIFTILQIELLKVLNRRMPMSLPRILQNITSIGTDTFIKCVEFVKYINRFNLEAMLIPNSSRKNLEDVIAALKNGNFSAMSVVLSENRWCVTSQFACFLQALPFLLNRKSIRRISKFLPLDTKLLALSL